MSFPFYVGDGAQARPPAPTELPLSKRSEMMLPQNYLADAGLVDAANVALLLGQPLLLTGEPGTGKSQFAYSLAWELGFDPPLKFEVKSTSSSRDLFYTYDALRRFQDMQSGIPSTGALPYLTYGALGAAILRSRERSHVERFLPPDLKHDGRTRSVVLIDEVDKAPRDFPNDILNELEQLYFKIPELGDAVVEADPALQPVVIITSNSEKDLPDAFLRRCVYYNIPFPDEERLAQIVAARLGSFASGSSPFLQDALNLFYKLREQNILRKKPATAELLGWMLALQEISGGAENPLDTPELAQRTLGTLIKTEEDRDRAQEIVKQWVASRKPQP